MKLLNNLLSATAMAITSEAVVMGVKAGLDPGLVVDVLNAGTARNTSKLRQISEIHTAQNIQCRVCHGSLQ